jgi:hypothetical protein
MNAYESLRKWSGKIPEVLGSLIRLPPELAVVSAGLAGHGVSRGLLKAFTYGLPQTGDTGDRPTRAEWGIEWEIIKLASALRCDILGFAGEKKGEYIHQVIPVVGREESRSNEGSNLFEAHMEAPHLPEPPDLVMITYLKNRERGPTALWPIEVLMSFMTAEDIELAQQPRFSVEMGESWGERKWFNYPIFERLSTGDFSMRLDLTSMKGVDDEAQSLLNKLFEACATTDCRLQNHLELVMDAGDVLLFDNRRNCHGRVPIPSIGLPEGDRRWLQRVYLRRKRTHYSA